MRKLLVLSTVMAMLGSQAANAATIQENTIFPDMDVIASQLVDGSAIGIRDIDVGANDIHAIMGESFTLTNATTLRAITLKSESSTTWSSGDDVINLWIGVDTDTNKASFVAGATKLLTTFDLNGVSVTAGNYYSINLASDLVLPAGDYAFQLSWAATGNAHQWFLSRANGDGDYEGGGLVNGQTTDGTQLDFPLDTTVGFGIDLVFGMHTSVIGTVPTFTVDPEEIDLQLIPPSTSVTGAVEVAFTSDTTMDISISISDESHPESYSVLSTTQQTISSNTTLEIEYDNSVFNLPSGSVATGLVTIAWNETGKTITNEVVVPISTLLEIPATFTRGGSDVTWDGLDGWNDNSSGSYIASTRLPILIDTVVLNNPGIAQLYADIDATVKNLSIVNTAANATVALTNDVTLSVVNNMTVGNPNVSGTGTGMVNQAAGTISVGGDLTIYSNATSGANSSYNVIGGATTVSGLLAVNGTLNVDGGTFTYDNADQNHQVSGAGLIKVQSGTLQSTASAATTVDNYECAIEISGGTVNIKHQAYYSGGLTVIGDAAEVNIGFINSTSILNFELGANGVSTIDGSGTWASLAVATINIDGSVYTGGSQAIELLKSSNLTADSTNATVNVTGFAPDYVTVVTIDEGNNNNVTLTITAPGYLGWSSEYGVGAYTNNEDGDVVNNLYEYGLGGNPTNAADIGMESVMESGAGYIDYVHVRRVEASNEISYALALSENLMFGNWSTNAGYTIVGYGPVVGEFDTVTNRIDTTGKTAEFIDLIIEEL